MPIAFLQLSYSPGSVGVAIAAVIFEGPAIAQAILFDID
jgi:hypothetical protein